MPNKNKPQRMFKTRGGAQQSRGSEKIFRKASDALFKKFLESDDPDEMRELRSKMNMADAGMYADSDYDVHGSFERGSMGRSKGETKPVKKAMGGAVRGYEAGGEVCRGSGAAVRGTKFRGVR